MLAPPTGAADSALGAIEATSVSVAMDYRIETLTHGDRRRHGDFNKQEAVVVEKPWSYLYPMAQSGVEKVTSSRFVMGAPIRET